jgi:hypothetical protein
MVTIDLTPEGIWGFHGDSVTIAGMLVNTTSQTQTVLAQTGVLMPNGRPYPGNPLLGPFRLTLQPYDTLHQQVTQAVPGNAPFGRYTYIGQVLAISHQVIDADSFPFTVMPDSGGWVGQAQVNDPDRTYDIGATSATDTSGAVWVIWEGTPPVGIDGVLYTHWNGIGWERELALTPLIEPDTTVDLSHSLTITPRNEPWALLDSRGDHPGAEAHVFWSRFEDGAWTEPERVDTAESHPNYQPIIASGGEAIWATWYGGISHYEVYASRWNGSGWDPEMQVSPDSGDDWMCRVIVDAQGLPHIAWQEWYSATIYYSRYDGTSWSIPVKINNTASELAWYGPEMALDSLGNLHVIWSGLSGDRDVYYSWSADGMSWSPEVMVNQDDAYNDQSTGVAANDPANVWAGWYKDAPGDDHAYAARFGGTSWLPEQRIDSDVSTDDGGGHISLGSGGAPWALFVGWPLDGFQYEIYYNHRVDCRRDRISVSQKRRR